MNYQFHFLKLYGDGEAPKKFEKLVCKALKTIHPSIRQVSDRGGDGGIDAYFGPLNNINDSEEELVIFQCKYFIDKIHKDQIIHSYQRAFENYPHMKKWVLCLPRLLNNKDQEWWEQLKTEKSRADGVCLELYDENDLLDCFKKAGILDSLLPPEYLSQSFKFYDHSVVLNNQKFTGRQDKLNDIYNAFNDECKIVVIHGMGGIGKTDLAKEFAVINKEMFPFSQMVSIGYKGKADARVNTILEVVLHNLYYSTYISEKCAELDIQQQLGVKMAALRTLDQDSLIIIDNANNVTTSDIEELRQFRCCFLITTRKSIESDHARSIKLEEMANEDLLLLFNHAYGAELPKEQYEKFYQLLSKIQNHTMTLELVALLMKNQHKTLDDILNIVDRLDYDDSHVYYPSSATGKEDQSVYAHLHAILDISSLSASEKRVLGCLSLIYHTGISTPELMLWIKLNNYNELLSLEKMKWLNIARDIITIHPLFSRIYFLDMPPSDEDCALICNAVSDKMDFDTCETFSDVYNLMDYGIFLNDRLNEKGYTANLDKLHNKLAIGYNLLGQYDKSYEIALSLKNKKNIPTGYTVKTTIFIAEIRLNQWDYQASLQWLEEAYAFAKKVELPWQDWCTVLDYLVICYQSVGNEEKLKWALNEKFNILLEQKSTTMVLFTLEQMMIFSKEKYHSIKKKLKQCYHLCLEQLDEDIFSSIMYLAFRCFLPFMKNCARSSWTFGDLADLINYALDKGDRSILLKIIMYFKIKKFEKNIINVHNSDMRKLFACFLGNNLPEHHYQQEEILFEIMREALNRISFGGFFVNFITLCDAFLYMTDYIKIPVNKKKLLSLVEEYYRNNNLDRRLLVANLRTVSGAVAYANFIGTTIKPEAAVHALQQIAQTLEETLPVSNRYYLATVYKTLGKWYVQIPNAWVLAEAAFLKALNILKQYNASVGEIAELLNTLGNTVAGSRKLKYFKESIKLLDSDNFNNCVKCKAYGNLVDYYYKELEPELAKAYLRKMKRTANKNKLCAMDCRADMLYHISKSKHSYGSFKLKPNLFVHLANVKLKMPHVVSQNYYKSKTIKQSLAWRLLTKSLFYNALKSSKKRGQESNYTNVLFDYIKGMDIDRYFFRYAKSKAKHIKRKKLSLDEMYLYFMIGDQRKTTQYKLKLMEFYNTKIETCGQLVSHLELLRLLRSRECIAIVEELKSPKKIIERVLDRIFYNILFEPKDVGFLSRFNHDYSPVRLMKRLDELLDKGYICSAEDLLFSIIERSPLTGYIPVAQYFYNTLYRMDDMKLRNGNFHRAEIDQGMADVRKIIGF